MHAASRRDWFNLFSDFLTCLVNNSVVTVSVSVSKSRDQCGLEAPSLFFRDFRVFFPDFFEFLSIYFEFISIFFRFFSIFPHFFGEKTNLTLSFRKKSLSFSKTLSFFDPECIFFCTKKAWVRQCWFSAFPVLNLALTLSETIRMRILLHHMCALGWSGLVSDSVSKSRDQGNWDPKSRDPNSSRLWQHYPLLT